MDVLRPIVARRWVAALCGSLAVTLGAVSEGAQCSRDVLTGSIETPLVEEGLAGATQRVRPGVGTVRARLDLGATAGLLQ